LRSDATNASLTDALPAGLTYVSYTASQGTYDTGAHVWTIGSLAKNATATLTLTATVTAGGGTTITNATPGTPDANYSFIDTGVLPRVQYYYWVEAIDTRLVPHDYGILSYEGFPLYALLVITTGK
jgi:Domain of unknown function DUF11